MQPSLPPAPPRRPADVLTRPVGAGEGHDRRLPRRTWTPRRLALLAGALALLAAVAWTLLAPSGGRRLAVAADRLTIATVERGAFQEYVAVTGTVLPLRTIYLDAVVGGQVAARLVEDGAFVEAGQPLVELTNDQLALQQLASETHLQDQLNALRLTRLALDQNELGLRQQLAELEFRALQLERDLERHRRLHERRVIARQDYERVRDEHAYVADRLALTRQSYAQDSLARALQLRQMETQRVRLERNLALLQATRDNLTVRAPIAGQLSGFAAEVGAAVGAGARVGQIDDLSGWRVRASIDEHYVARIATGLRAMATIGGHEHALEVTAVYPEIREGRFEADLVFLGPPPHLRRGQTLRLRLALDDPEEALLLPRGGFLATTGGHWAYVLQPSGTEAVRRPIRLGRQNPVAFEVLEGLRPGDRVVVSSYDALGDADVLVLR